MKSHLIAGAVALALAAPAFAQMQPTGPLTNIALAARLEPAIVDRVREVVLMGGGARIGNWSAVAEFNIVVDPEAAAIVFEAGWPVTMVGLDLTHQALATDEVRKKLAIEGAEPTPSTPAQYAADMDREEKQWGEVVKAAGIKAE